MAGSGWGVRLCGARGKVAVVLAVLVISGCASGPEWKRAVALRRPTEDITGRKVVVSNFTRMASHTSVTQSANIRTISESVRTNDASSEIAAGLQKSGIVAEARLGVTHRDLRPDELLVTGAVIVGPGKENLGVSLVDGLLLGFSLCSIGGILPWIPMEVGPECEYRVDLIGPDGRYLAQSGNQTLRASYTALWVWGAMGGNDRIEDVLRLMIDKVTQAIATAIKASQESPGGNR